MQLLCVGLRVRDFQRSLRFYTRALGLRVLRRGDTRGWGGGLWALLQDPRSRRVIELNWYPRGSLFFERYRIGAELDHVDFTVGTASRQSLERAYRRLLRNGAKPTRWTPGATEGWMASVTDPNGIWITLTRRPTRAERNSMALEQ